MPDSTGPLSSAKSPNISTFPQSVALVVEVSPSGGWDEVFQGFRSAGFNTYLIRNDYDRQYYMAHHSHLARPVAITDLPEEQADVLFSRVPFEQFSWPPKSNWRRWRELRVTAKPSAEPR